MSSTYAIHIQHPHGNIGITTSAGASKNQWGNLEIDVLFMSIGLLSRIDKDEREDYFNHVQPKNHEGLVIVPIHWDTFMKKLDLNMGLQKIPSFVDDVDETINYSKEESAKKGVNVHAMNLMEQIHLFQNTVSH